MHVDDASLGGDVDPCDVAVRRESEVHAAGEYVGQVDCRLGDAGVRRGVPVQRHLGRVVDEGSGEGQGARGGDVRSVARVQADGQTALETRTDGSRHREPIGGPRVQFVWRTAESVLQTKERKFRVNMRT